MVPEEYWIPNVLFSPTKNNGVRDLTCSRVLGKSHVWKKQTSMQTERICETRCIFNSKSHNHLFTNKNQAVILVISIQIIHVKNPNDTSWLDPVIKLRLDNLYVCWLYSVKNKIISTRNLILSNFYNRGMGKK